MEMQDFTPAFAQPVATFDLWFDDAFSGDRSVAKGTWRSKE